MQAAGTHSNVGFLGLPLPEGQKLGAGLLAKPSFGITSSGSVVFFVESEVFELDLALHAYSGL